MGKRAPEAVRSKSLHALKDSRAIVPTEASRRRCDPSTVRDCAATEVCTMAHPPRARSESDLALRGGHSFGHCAPSDSLLVIIRRRPHYRRLMPASWAGWANAAAARRRIHPTRAAVRAAAGRLPIRHTYRQGPGPSGPDKLETATALDCRTRTEPAPLVPSPPLPPSCCRAPFPTPACPPSRPSIRRTGGLPLGPRAGTRRHVPQARKRRRGNVPRTTPLAEPERRPPDIPRA